MSTYESAAPVAVAVVLAVVAVWVWLLTIGRDPDRKAGPWRVIMVAAAALMVAGVAAALTAAPALVAAADWLAAQVTPR